MRKRKLLFTFLYVFLAFFAALVVWSLLARHDARLTALRGLSPSPNDHATAPEELDRKIKAFYTLETASNKKTSPAELLLAKTIAYALISAVIKRDALELPAAFVGVSYSPEITERGVAYVSTRIYISQCRVTLGPAAFRSLPILTSTLVHEISGHCSQSPLIIYLKNIPSRFGAPAYGDLDAEYEAYGLELKGDFGLSRSDEGEIRSLREEHLLPPGPLSALWTKYKNKYRDSKSNRLIR